jgi:hypothetical protein
MALEISPFKQKEIMVKLLVKSTPQWSEPTVVLRLLSSTSKQYCCYLTAPEAITSVAAMEAGRFDRLTVPPKCVKTNDQAPSKYYGISDTTTLRFKYPVQFALATSAESNSFPGTLAYNFVPFATLEQKPDGAFVDLLGRITHVDASELHAMLPKVVITLTSADYFERIECLGVHAQLRFQEAQTVACKGLMLKTYKGNRSCSTTMLSYLLLNAGETVGTVSPPSSQESPCKKATLTKASRELTTLLVRDWAESMLQETTRTTPSALPSGLCSLRGHLLPLTMENFPSAPTYERNGLPKIRFQADCADENGTLRYVTVWDTAARELLQVTGAALIDLWAACENEGGIEAFLERMNRATDTEYEFLLEVSIREWKGAYSYQISINNATEIDAE